MKNTWNSENLLYESPKIEVTTFMREDVLTASPQPDSTTPESGAGFGDWM
jgi:hypothetical protein